MIGDVQTEEAILVFAVPGSWFLLMFFAGYGITYCLSYYYETKNKGCSQNKQNK